jgi:hypothetical protein
LVSLRGKGSALGGADRCQPDRRQRSLASERIARRFLLGTKELRLSDRPRWVWIWVCQFWQLGLGWVGLEFSWWSREGGVMVSGSGSLLRHLRVWGSSLVFFLASSEFGYLRAWTVESWVGGWSLFLFLVDCPVCIEPRTTTTSFFCGCLLFVAGVGPSGRGAPSVFQVVLFLDATLHLCFCLLPDAAHG